MNPLPSAVPPLQTPVRKSGGCCVAGCVTLGVTAFVLLALFLGGMWWLYGKAVDSFTAPFPVSIQLEPPSEAQFAEANEKLMQVRAAAGERRAVEIAFTAADLNALIARDPDFAHPQRKARVAIANSLVTLDLSAPLDSIPLPKMKGRWFNGTGVFGLAYDETKFHFNLRSITANGRSVPDSAFGGFARVFDDSFNEGFDKAMERDKSGNSFWKNVKSLNVVDDKLIVTTLGDDTI